MRLSDDREDAAVICDTDCADVCSVAATVADVADVSTSVVISEFCCDVVSAAAVYVADEGSVVSEVDSDCVDRDVGVADVIIASDDIASLVVMSDVSAEDMIASGAG